MKILNGGSLSMGSLATGKLNGRLTFGSADEDSSTGGGGFDILTEGGDSLVTEDGDHITTEDAP